MSTSDKITYEEYTSSPYGFDHLKWKDRLYAAKSQERLGSYFSHKMLQKKSSAGEAGVIETRSYQIDAIESKPKSDFPPLQIQGREAVKLK